MAENPGFGNTNPELQPILLELSRREPIFHSAGFGQTLDDFERSTAADFWEVGASGRRYSREFILNMRRRDALVDAAEAGWKASGFGIRQLGPDCFLVTYTLDQGGRVTRRATIWERAMESWQLVYHQGTVVSEEGGDDSLPNLPNQGSS